MTEKKIYYLTPLLLALIMFFSNFLNTNLFDFESHNFTVWFVLSVFAFGCGWLTNKTLGYNHGGKVIFAVVIASVIISLLLISLFKNYFKADDLVSENIILYTLRNVTLGAMSFFGMAVSEVIILQRELHSEKQKSRNHEVLLTNARKEAELIINEAKLKASEIILDAKKESTETFENKKAVEKQLRELIIAESELIKKYENK